MNRLARLLTRLPLGGRLVNLLHASKLTWLRCFPGKHPARRCQSYLRLAYHAWLHRRLTRALKFVDQAEIAAPDCADVFFLRGLIRHFQSEWFLARQSLEKALSLGLPSKESRQAHSLLAEITLSARDLDLACMHVEYTLEDTPSFPPRVRRLEAWDRLSEIALNGLGAMDLAQACLNKKETPSDLLTNLDPELRDAVILPDDWARNIGHLAVLDGQVKLRQLGIVPPRPITLLAPPGRVANEVYLAHWRAHLRIVQDAEEVARLAPLTPLLGQRVSSFWPTSLGEQRYFMEAMGILQLQWEREKRGPLLRLVERCEEAGKAFLREQGIPSDAWFVAMHLREPGFHREMDSQRNRDVVVRTYLPAIRAIVKRGGLVVRLGNPGMTPLPRMAGVLDYARHPQRRQELDVFFCARARFFIGTASGLVHVPFTFGVPCVLTNWVSNAMVPPFAGGDLFVPKRLREAKSGRLLTWEEQCAPAIRNLHYNHLLLVRRGLEVVDNSPDDLLGVIEEMLDQREGREGRALGNDPLQEKIRSQAAKHGLFAPPQMGRDFLNTQSGFLEG